MLNKSYLLMTGSAADVSTIYAEMGVYFRFVQTINSLIKVTISREPHRKAFNIQIVPSALLIQQYYQSYRYDSNMN